ncbi:pipsqueak isoform X2 [Neodiprion pinetum]|uniref:Protein bric-a-brac 1 isoform X2 n=1 Tax=Neodiprion lecontei TaxID=441921 RepID=A0ABM3FNK7_NEOLC|nr:protein bric-a-brac 1 isoform X2 [Neodiprion fabricii]XP_046472104.1 protein bric-a-brac 1 isoform X2 [Neodiprion pinetum]XP_046589583.1 protein bric-a-brac 1 isoform X2 [Neodiprion lecontei]XP_046610017.1 protein bric-a-brac 1 isoform X2 [Neodiprion virginianus]
MERNWGTHYSGGMAGQHYCLRWNNYQSNMTSVFHQLLQTEAFVDVTLACNEASLKAHKVVLSACSSYFQKLLLSNPCKHPTIIMPQDVCFTDLKFIIEFVYRGEIDVSQAELQSLLKTADQLKIKGLCEVPESREGPPSSVSLSSPPRDRDSSGTGTPRLNYTKLRRQHHPRYKRPRFEARSSDTPGNRHFEKYKEEETEGFNNRDDKENHRDWQTEDEEFGEPTIVLESRQKEISNGNTNNNNGMGHYGHHTDPGDVDLPPETQPTPPSATLVGTTITHLRDPDHQSTEIQNCDSVKIKFETLHTMDSTDTIDIDSHMSDRASVSSKTTGDNDNMMMITPELLGLMPSGSSGHSDGGDNGRSHSGQIGSHHHGSKSWTQDDMDAALDALRNHDMSLTKASATFGIPSTTLWQRAHRLGIDTPKKDGPTKSWSDESLNNALEALRTGTISANKASKAFGIPSSTLYKIARREGIRLAAPFNASPTTWSPADLDRALEAIRSGQTSVQRASTEFGIPTGTLYGRCKREGIELSRSNPTPWSEDAMTEALEAVRMGHMSINQAAIHYNLPYSSLYGRFKRGKYEEPVGNEMSQDSNSLHYHSPNQNHSSSVPDQMPYQGS